MSGAAMQNPNMGLFDGRLWDKCGDPALNFNDFEGKDCRVAVEASPAGHLICVAYEFTLVIAGVGHFYAFVDHYAPEGLIATSANPSWARWRESGALIATPGSVANLPRVRADIAYNLRHRFRAMSIAADPWRLGRFMRDIGKDLGEGLVVEYAQRESTLGPPTKHLIGLHREGRFHHNGDPVLASMIRSVVGRFDGDGVRIAKARTEDRIEGPLALVMTHGCWLRAAGVMS